MILPDTPLRVGQRIRLPEGLGGGAVVVESVTFFGATVRPLKSRPVVINGEVVFHAKGKPFYISATSEVERI